MVPTTRPLVVVCGWMNAPTRGVVKYAELFEQLGYKTTSLESHLSHLFLNPSQIHATDANKFLQEMKANQVVIVPHMISNGGCISWYCFEQHLKRAGVRVQVPAMIFDSSPNSHRGFQAFPEIAKQSLDALTDTITTPLVRSIVQMGLTVTYALVVLRWGLVGAPDPVQRNFPKLIDQDKAIPKLFLYSSGDKLVTAPEIQVAISRARNHGTPVVEHDFLESKHVAHYVHDPQTYTTLVSDFLKKYTS